jgi:S1-C subfamily serine protease
MRLDSPDSPVTRDANSRIKTPAPWRTVIAITLATLVTVGCDRFSSASADPAKHAKLADVLAREQALKAELQALSTGEAAHCPPGYIAEADRGADGATDVSGKLAPLSRKDMVERLECATVLVLAPNAKGIASGTGFFISPQNLITNRHVVESSIDGRVLLGSRMLQRIHRGTVVAVTDNSTPGSPDFAMIRLEGGQAPGVLEMNVEPTKLSEVTAAGYPGLVMRGDPNYVKLVRDGDLSAAPDLSVTRGTIQSLQNSSAGTPIVVHTAAIYQGNSGGPLVDACGRVVGVNTFIAVDQQQAGRVSYAIQSRTLGTFAQRAGTPIKLDTRPCE